METYINEIKKLVNRIKEEKKDDCVETGWFELDNLDEAKLLSDESGRIFIENEHGTTFDLEELSDVEFTILIYILKNDLK
jgi:hypothetical protein